MKNKKKSCCILLFSLVAVLLTVLPLFSACSNNNGTNVIESADQLNDKKYTITISAGASAASAISEYFPNANITYSNSDADAFMMVKTGKADAYAHDNITLEYAITTGGVSGLSLLKETYGAIDIAVGVNKKYSEQLLPQVNAFIEQLKEDGTLDDMYKRWVLDGNDSMPSIPEPTSPDPNNVITIGTAGLVQPMTYYGANNEITGYEVELIKRYAYFANVTVQVEVMGFDAIHAGLQSDKLHMAFSNLNVTEERKQVIDFSTPYLTSEVAFLVNSDRVPTTGNINTLDDLHGKRIGHVMGVSYAPLIEQRYPDSTTLAYNTFADIIQALKSGRIDAYFADSPVAICHLKETNGLKIIQEPLCEDNYAYIISDEQKDLLGQINDTIAKFESDGTLQALKEKWIEGDGDPNLKFDESIPTPNGVLNIGTSIDAMPFAYRAGQNIVGYDVELIYLICAELGYKPVITEYEFSALLASIKSREDILIGCITYTEERAQTMTFTDTTYVGGPVAVVLAEEEETGFFDKLKDSFYRTFVQENRWKLIANGLLVTIEISLLSILFGTLLGFVYSFALRSKNKVVYAIANALSVIINGLPLLVILMVLYYVIFAKTTLSAIIIGVIGFTLEFANTVAGTLNTGIKAVDKGQIEAAESMGYSKLMVFKKITFPQVANQMFGQYSGAIISLIKSTSIIGYITVEDLTKAGDIIRSLTYEAFFPLIVSAIIYFVISRLFVFLLSRFAKTLDPKQRKREIKGVKTDD